MISQHVTLHAVADQRRQDMFARADHARRAGSADASRARNGRRLTDAIGQRLPLADLVREVGLWSRRLAANRRTMSSLSQ